MVYVVSRGEVEGLEDGDELLFERSILAGGTTEYTINSNKVMADQYSKGLKELGIDIKARNFLVFQGDVDAVAKKGPKAMRDYFELFCGSGELKEPFERAEVRLEESRKEQLTRATLRRTTTLEVKDLRAAKEESEKHDALAKEVEGLRTRLMLVKLFYLDASITSKEEEAREAADSLGEAMAREGEVLGREKECAKAAATASKTMHKKELQLQAKGGQVRQALEATATIEARIASLRAVAGGGRPPMRPSMPSPRRWSPWSRRWG
jgi:structural maintenance of chromosome 1